MLSNCKVCGKAFPVNKSKIKKGYGKYCSLKCRGIGMSGSKCPRWTGGLIEKYCLFCGKPFYTKQSRHEVGYGKFCNRQCYSKWLSLTRRGSYAGSKNPGWKGGKKEKSCLCCGKMFSVFPSAERKKTKTIKGGAFCSRSCRSIWLLKRRTSKETNIELLTEKLLLRIGIRFEKQKVIPEGRTVADFYIPEQSLVIYADGTYWHSKVGVKKRDNTQDLLLGLHGYKVLRFSEEEINKTPNNCLRKIKSIIAKGGA